MHSALTIPELVSTICGELDRDTSNRKQGQATLAAFARTCKTVSAIALSVLWRQQNGFVPLLCCLSTEVLGIAESAYSGRAGGCRKTLRLQQPIRPEHWSRVFNYSRFTQDILLWEPENAFGNLDDHTLESISRSLSEQPVPLLQNLQKVRYRARSVRRAAYAFLCVVSGCNVASILYTSDGVPSTPDLHFIQCLAQKSWMSVTEFSCNGLVDKMSPHITCYESLVTTLRSLPNLQFVSIPCYHPLLEQLSKHPSLRALSVESRAFSEFSPPSPATKRHRIQGLNSLSLDFEFGTHLIEFLDHFDFTDSKLETLHIHLLHNCPTDMQNRLLEAFQSSLYTGVLTNFSIFVRYATESPEIPLGDVLNLLIASPKLDTLEVLLPEYLTPGMHCTDAGDTLVAQIGRRWGLLRQLTLASCVDLEGTVQGEAITLKSLFVLAECCPALSFLRIMIDASGEVPDVRALLPDGRMETAHRGEIQLDFTSPSPISAGNVESVARFLGDVFWSVGGLVNDETLGCRELWEEVEDIVLALHVA
ncbi:hypothetical protein BDV98DRAFT_604434 [Pterulicium gracile]|uniref:F-box domain-containing protein n=1 Tax=Pterulicium gracile TaxID=1884261 RepID=A0A5C3QIL3_9AGAR|nr:hypothetical protein BDV98DRAFT_604434 [Pterula gracilis]